MLICNELRCRCRTWTDDLWLMRPTSYPTAPTCDVAAYSPEQAACIDFCKIWIYII